MGAGAERRAGRRELKPSAGTPGSILCCGETPGSRERVGRGSGEGPRLQVGTGVGNRRRTIPRALGVCAPGGQGSAGIGSSVPASRAGAGRSRSRRSGRTFFQGWAKPGCWEPLIASGSAAHPTDVPLAPTCSPRAARASFQFLAPCHIKLSPIVPFHLQPGAAAGHSQMLQPAGAPGEGRSPTAIQGALAPGKSRPGSATGAGGATGRVGN